jgi:uncharacterized membrane protein YjjP (DUF1212 family)
VLGLALALAGIAAVLGGAAVAKLTDRSMLAGGLRQFTAAFLATGVAFAVGHLIGGSSMSSLRGTCSLLVRFCEGHEGSACRW